jgi:hypothetical protein
MTVTAPYQFVTVAVSSEIRVIEKLYQESLFSNAIFSMALRLTHLDCTFMKSISRFAAFNQCTICSVVFIKSNFLQQPTFSDILILNSNDNFNLSDLNFQVTCFLLTIIKFTLFYLSL